MTVHKSLKIIAALSLITAFSSQADTPPYSFSQYQSVLDNSYLQTSISTKLINQPSIASFGSTQVVIVNFKTVQYYTQ